MNYPKQNFAKIERTHPGFVAVAGPFQTEHTTPLVQRTERAACVRALREQKKADSDAKLVTIGRVAWVLRKKPLVIAAPNFSSEGCSPNPTRKRLSRITE